MGTETADLRTILRQSTAHSHDQLDEAMRSATGWTTPDDYAAFLSLQFAARQPVEQWLEVHALDDLRPPPQSPLIAADLTFLEAPHPISGPTFELRVDGDNPRATILGVAWVLAGSALGNRAILHDLRRGGHGDWANAFLSDDTMLAFWGQMRPEIEAPTSEHEAKEATRAALATFAHFIALAAGPLEPDDALSNPAAKHSLKPRPALNDDLKTQLDQHNTPDAHKDMAAGTTIKKETI